MARGLPRATAAWARSGWVVESGHVPGGYRMLGIWAASLASPFVTVPVLTGPLTMQGAMLAALAIAVTGISLGAFVYGWCSRSFTLADTASWGLQDTRAQRWRSVDREPLPRPVTEPVAAEPATLAPVNTGRAA